MKLWWLKLYTIPALRKYSIPLAVWSAASILCAIFLPRIREITFLVAMYPWYVFIGHNENTIANNLDFHKVHIPFREIRMAVGLDLIIQVGIFLGIFFAAGYFPWMNIANSDSLLDILGTRTMSVLVLATFTLMIVIAKTGVVKQMQAKKKTGNKLAYITAFALAFLGYKALSMGLSSLLIVYILISVLSMHTLTDWFLENFHIFPRFNHVIRIVSLPLIIVCFTVVTWFASSRVTEEIADSSYRPFERLQSFMLFRDFGVKLDQHTVTDLLGYAIFDDEAVKIFASAEPSVFEVPVETIIKRPNYMHYYAYLRSGEVSRPNLEYLYRKSLSDKGPWKDTEFYPQYRLNLARHYPEARNLPERKIASQKGGIK